MLKTEPEFSPYLIFRGLIFGGIFGGNCVLVSRGANILGDLYSGFYGRSIFVFSKIGNHENLGIVTITMSLVLRLHYH